MSNTVIDLAGLESLPAEQAEQVKQVFTESVEAKVKAEKELIEQYADSLKKAYDKKIKQIQESADNRIKANARKAKMLAEQYADDVEARFNEQAIAEMKRNAIKARQEIIRENKIPEMQAEDADKLNKLLKLFEEMLAIFGKTVVDVVEDSKSEDSEKIEELEKEVETTEKENEELKEHIESLTRNNIMLEMAIEKGLGFDEIKDFARGVRFRSKGQFTTELMEIVENRSTKSKFVPTRARKNFTESAGVIEGSLANNDLDSVVFSGFNK